MQAAEERRQALERSQLEGLADRDRRADQVRAKKVTLRDVRTIEIISTKLSAWF